MTGKNKTQGVLFVLALLLLAFRLAGGRQEPPEVLEAVLKATGASFLEGEVQYFADLERRFLEMAELEKILLEAARLVGLTGQRAEQSAGETYRLLDLKGSIPPGSDLHIVVQSNPGDKNLGLPPQTYLLVFCRHTSLEILKKTASRLEVALRPLAPGGQTSIFLTGEVRRRISPAEMTLLAERAVKAVDGRIVEGMREGGLLSVSAYTPRFGRSLTDGRDRINLNLALRIHSEDDTTVVLAGFPVIHGSY